MLYLSRLITIPQRKDLSEVDFTVDNIKTGVYDGMRTEDTAYGVVDTDDNVETIVPFIDMLYIIDDLNIPIEGIISHRGARAYIDTVPYQDMRYCSALQAKTKTLLGVDIHTYEGEVTAIIPDRKVMKDGTRIRLSEFGRKMSDAVHIDWVQSRMNTKKLIIVLDDNILVYGDRVNIILDDVYWDISEVTDDDFIQSMAKAVDTYPRYRHYIIDRHERV